MVIAIVLFHSQKFDILDYRLAVFFAIRAFMHCLSLYELLIRKIR